MSKYYQEKIEEINDLISEKEFDEAHRLIETELKMPYIPLAFEDSFKALEKEVRNELNSNIKVKDYSEEDLVSLLNGSLEEANQAVEIFRSSNIRKYIDVIEAYLSTSPHPLIRCLLIEALMDQDVTSDISLDYDGLDVKFIPTYVETPLEADGAIECVKIIGEYFENDNPSFYRMCLETLVKDLYFRLPFNLEKDEAIYEAVAVIKYVYKASNDEKLYESFIIEKNLAKYDGYDLLLDTYDI